jgi:hypothetical protein
LKPSIIDEKLNIVENIKIKYPDLSKIVRSAKEFKNINKTIFKVIK